MILSKKNLVLRLLNSRTRMTLKSFSSDFPDLINLCSLIDLSGLSNLNDLNSLYSPISFKNFQILMIWSSMAPKWPIMVIFCGMDHQKSKCLLIYGIFSVGGCWGQSMLFFFWKLVDKTQISKPQDHTDTFKQNLTSIFLSARPKLLLTVQYEIPCIRLARKISLWDVVNLWCRSFKPSCWL